MGMRVRFFEGDSGAARRGTGLGLALVALALSVGCAGTQASMTPVQFSVWPGAQVFTQDTPVRGMTLNIIAGDQDDVAGLDLGLFNSVAKEFAGVSVGLVNNGHGNVRGLQLGGGNTADATFVGLQAAPVNEVGEMMKGAQIGGVNMAGKCTGLQLGVINTVDSTGCVQIGLINLNPSGFLPFFPVFLVGF